MEKLRYKLDDEKIKKKYPRREDDEDHSNYHV
jgi:hypothetical protein